MFFLIISIVLYCIFFSHTFVHVYLHWYNSNILIYILYTKLWCQCKIIIHFDYFITLFALVNTTVLEYLSIFNKFIVHYCKLTFNFAMFKKTFLNTCNIDPFERSFIVITWCPIHLCIYCIIKYWLNGKKISPTKN